MGRMGQVDHPDVVEAIDQVGRACQLRNIALGYFGTTAESVQAYMEKGYKLICAGVDGGIIASGADEILQKLKSQG